jgi:gliding motility-associated-like protein
LWDLTYWVVVTDSCGTSVSDTINLEYYELNTDINYNESTYSADVEVFSSTSEGPFGFAWINIFGDTISFTENIYSLCEGTYFAVTTDFSNDCSVVDTLLVEYDLPFGIVDVLTTTVYDDINLWGASPYSYLWSNGQVKQKSDLCPGSHWVEVTDVNNCLVREDFTIDDLIITLDPASSIIECNLENLDVNIQATATGGIAPYSFQWWNGFVGNSINLGLNPGNYSLTVTDANNCINDTSFKIASLTSECIPNVFSPNGDNINDSWSLEDTFLYSDSKVSIYGRFGSLIFESVGYYEKWNGTNTNGAEVPDGVYFYSIELGNGFDPINGTISILR